MSTIVHLEYLNKKVLFYYLKKKNLCLIYVVCMCSIFRHMNSYQFMSLGGRFAKSLGIQSGVDLVKVRKQDFTL